MSAGGGWSPRFDQATRSAQRRISADSAVERRIFAVQRAGCYHSNRAEADEPFSRRNQSCDDPVGAGSFVKEYSNGDRNDETCQYKKCQERQFQRKADQRQKASRTSQGPADQTADRRQMGERRQWQDF